MQTPNFRDVGDRLKEKFHSALRMHVHNSASGELILKRGNRRGKKKKPAPNSELIFLERSPDFCNPIPALDVSGTEGRYCNRTSTGTDGCDSMCCGRGYNVRLERRTEWCNCTFHWCCFVKCKQCTSSHWVETCKWDQWRIVLWIIINLICCTTDEIATQSAIYPLEEIIYE